MFSKKSKNKKYGKATNVFKKSNTKGYKRVHIMYLFDELAWIKKNTTLNSGTGGPTVKMVENLIGWMGLRKKPIWMFWEKEQEWKNWVDLREDHWLLDHEKRAELIAKKSI